MNACFLSIVNMSISASWIVLAVLLLRFLLKKAPKWITVLLWAVVAIRLICPLSIESEISLIPSAETISPGIMTDTNPQIYTGISAINTMVNPMLRDSFSPTPEASVNPLQVWIPVASLVWLIGILVMALYGLISYWRLRRNVATAVLFHDRIFQSENVASPFVLGVIKPRIYLPFHIKEQEFGAVIAHEEAHIRRKDHWWKPLGFAILSLHWFNPLMWLAYVLLCRDIELACDEKVVKNLTAEERADYSQALLHSSVSRRAITYCPLAFGEVGVMDRVKSVLHYKKPGFWILSVGIVASAVLAACFLTNPTHGALGTLENLEFISLTDRTENTACVWISDGFSYERVGIISEDLLRNLASLKTSKEEISLDRSEDRDRSHTIVLQSEQQAKASPNSYLDGLYIHFNSDFTSVWINNGVKPTLTYKVIDPQRAEEVFGYIANYNVREPAVQFPTISSDATDIESLKKKFPMYFDLGTFKGLEVYIWQMAENSYSCGVLQGVNRNYTPEELWNLHKNPASLEEMRAIIAYYLEEGLAVKEDIILIPVTMPHSSYYYEIDDAYNAKLNELFWSGFSDNSMAEVEPPHAELLTVIPIRTINGNLKTYFLLSDGTYQYNGCIYKYRLEITGRMPLAVADTTYVYLSNMEEISFEQAMWASGISSRINDYFSSEEAVLVEIHQESVEERTVFTKTGNGNLMSSEGVEYTHFANEGILYYLGELEYMGGVQGEAEYSQHMGLSFQTGIFAIKNNGNDNILIRRSADSEWFSIYRKVSLPPFDFSADNCIRLEFLPSSRNTDIHATCNGGISSKTEIAKFLSEVRSQKGPREAGLYDLVIQPNGMYENCYVCGIICGFFEEEPGLAIRMYVTSYNDLAYSVSIDGKEYVLPESWLLKLQNATCTP